MLSNKEQRRASVVCLHSSMSHGGQWRALVDRLGDEFNVITPNLLGYSGAGDCFAGLSLEDEVAAVMRQIDAIDGELHLVGHSFGGAVALRLASMHRHRIASLTVYEPVWFSLFFDSGLGGEEIQEIGRIQKLLGGRSRFEQQRGARQFINYWAGGDGWSPLPGAAQDRLVSLSAKVAAEFGALMAAGPATQELAKLDVPVQLLCGTETRFSARTISELLAEILPGVQYHRLQGLAHMAPVTHADDVNPLIVDHILANANHKRPAVA